MTDTREFSKHVQIKATDSAAQRATGVVLTPWEVDTQRDFLRPKGIRNLHNSDPKNGVMHAAFPEADATIERNEVLEADATIDGEAFEAGEWVITRQYHDEALWELVEDGVLNGFSIGGRITSDYEYDPDELPGKVRFPDGVEPGGATEIRDGAVEEISDVDIPAVPAAEYATVKQRDLGKTAFHEADGEDEFVELMTDRGHEPADARRLYDYLDRHAKAMTQTHKQEDDPEEAPRPDVGDTVRWESDASGAVDGWRYGVVVDGLQDSDDDLVLVAVYEPSDGEWQNRNEQTPVNVDSLIPIGDDGVGSLPPIDQIQASHDMTTDSIPDDDVPDDATKWRRFKALLFGDEAGSSGPDDGTDDTVIPEVPLDGDVEKALSKARDAVKEGRTLNRENQQSLMAAHDAIEAALAEELDFDTNRFTDDPFTDFDVADYSKSKATDTETDMTEKDEDPPEWAKGLTETVEQIEKRVDDLEGEDDDDAEKSDEDGRPEWADDLAEKVSELDERLDKVAKATADTGQLDGTGGDEESNAKRAAIEKEKEVFTR